MIKVTPYFSSRCSADLAKFNNLYVKKDCLLNRLIHNGIDIGALIFISIIFMYLLFLNQQERHINSANIS